MIRDIIIIGIRDDRLRERLLRETNLDLPKTIQAGIAAEETKKHAQAISSASTKGLELQAIDRKGKNTFSNRRDNDKSYSKSNSQIWNCKYCGGSHNRGNCPTYHKICRFPRVMHD